MYFLAAQSVAQDIVGLWEVIEVTVGGKVMTPVAKWTRLNEDGTFQSGNGWLQNSAGIWSYDAKNTTFTLMELHGLPDSFGGFKISFDYDRMIWERMEDTDQVIVKLKKIAALPESTADRLVGLWDLKEMTRNGKSEKSAYDPNDKYYIHIRWDRMYVERATDGSKTYGYWHINAHRPELTLIRKDGKSTESWTVEVEGKILKLSGISETNKSVQMGFTRINEFPE